MESTGQHVDNPRRRPTSRIPERGSARIGSLDTARGIFVVVSLCAVAVLEPRPGWLTHAAWFGITPIDIVFPTFVTLSGCGLAFAYGRSVAARQTARRCIVLLMAGLTYNALTSPERIDLATMWVTGPLQTYALLVLVVALIHLAVRNHVGWGIVTFAVSGVWAFLLFRFGQRCPGSSLLPECNPSAIVDSRVFGVHMYERGVSGHDPVGLVAFVGTFITAAAGVTAGHLIQAFRRRPNLLASLLAGWACAGGGVGLALGSWVPSFKRLWTPSFGLQMAALGLALLCICYVAIDLPRAPRLRRVGSVLSWPLVGLGRNALLVYFGSHVLVVLLIRSTGSGSGRTMADDLASALAIWGPSHLGLVVPNLLAWGLLAASLHRSRVYVHA